MVGGTVDGGGPGRPGPPPADVGRQLAGFALDRLQRRWSGLRAALAVGVLWAVWHLPLCFLEGYYSAFGTTRPDPVEHLGGILVASVLYSWVYNRTGRSVLAVVVLHFMQNFNGDLLGAAPRVDTYTLGVLAAFALAVVRIEGEELGRQRGAVPAG